MSASISYDNNDDDYDEENCLNWKEGGRHFQKFIDFQFSAKNFKGLIQI